VSSSTKPTASSSATHGTPMAGPSPSVYFVECGLAGTLTETRCEGEDRRLGCHFAAQLSRSGSRLR
jgi:hypothetical protein